MKTKEKFNKEKCYTCKYRGLHPCGYLIGRTADGNPVYVHCNYAALTGDTCLVRAEKGAIVDRRGEDSENCLLYGAIPSMVSEKGTKKNQIIFGRKLKGGNNAGRSKVLPE